MVTFPVLAEEQRRRLLNLPSGKLRVVFDTDAKNEIDDQFALAWALLSPDRLMIEGVYAAPFSFQHRYGSESGATGARAHVTAPPGVGMERSYYEILVVYDKLGMNPDGLVFKGASAYLTSYDAPGYSPAVEHLITRARAGTPENPLYIIAIGCVTNIASALLIAPDIIDRIVVTWTAGFPTTIPYANPSLNMEQDMLASRLLFDSGVPLVYLPGFHVGAQLRLSLPEMEAWVRGRGAIGDYLYWLYTHNPLWELHGVTEYMGRSWVIWDLINVAWLLNPAWVPSELVPSPHLTEEKRWQPAPNRHMIREAYEIDRDAIFRDFFAKLQQAS